MRFIAQSSGGKLILVAALALLFCLLLFTILSWSLLGLYSEHEASTNAQLHLSAIRQAYQKHTTTLIQELDKISQELDISSTRSPQTTPERIRQLFASAAVANRFSTLELMDRKHQILAGVGSAELPAQTITAATTQLVDQALQRQQAVLSLQEFSSSIPGSQANSSAQWTFSLAIPTLNSQGANEVLVATQPVDDAFAQTLIQGTDSRIALCLGSRVQGMAGITPPNFAASTTISQQAFCQPGKARQFHASQSFLLLAASAPLTQQITGSPSLVITTIEPIYTPDLHKKDVLFLIGGLGLIVFALGVIIYAYIIRIFITQPLQRLQSFAQSLVSSATDRSIPAAKGDELGTLARALSVLSTSLHSESQALTEQTRNLLSTSDTLISTLNLEHLLSEFVSGMGQIMRAKHVALLLYGPDTYNPWAVAHWSDQKDIQLPSTLPPPLRANKGTVKVHVDPKGDITLAATTKMAAIPVIKPVVNSSSGKRAALRATRITKDTQDQPEFATLPRPHIPDQVLRDLDMSLARLVIQRRKIAYGEDVAQIYSERGEAWANMALEAGYQSAIAVPLLLRDRAIGAFILYMDHPHQISHRDTFLLSTASIQASMAIQNALLFVEVKEKNAALERANQLKSQFLANVTHELRTPLHSIISYGALLLEGFVDGGLTAEQEEHIQFMVHRAEDLAHLVNDMLDLSKIEADRIEVKPEPLDLGTCLGEVVNQLKPLATNKKLYLNLEMARDLPPAFADSYRVRQVAINLVSNAIKFTEQGGVTIRCSFIKEQDMLLVAVEDSGIGISPAAIGYIFEAFRQADGSTTRRFGGTGLGLTIARKLIELQGGEIAVESVVGQGSTFSFTLPAATSTRAVI
jgi:signal transduction histidine kinase